MVDPGDKERKRANPMYTAALAAAEEAPAAERKPVLARKIHTLSRRFLVAVRDPHIVRFRPFRIRSHRRFLVAMLTCSSPPRPSPLSPQEAAHPPFPAVPGLRGARACRMLIGLTGALRSGGVCVGIVVLVLLCWYRFTSRRTTVLWLRSEACSPTCSGAASPPTSTYPEMPVRSVLWSTTTTMTSSRSSCMA